ncbi:MAG: hypothetical protein LLG40_13420 [Deltaproteobacteria bacterium]|nr:hypothetical protein [Deltaproteobacteria bacterium]
MRRQNNILALLMLMVAMVASFYAPMSVRAQEARTLTTMDFNIVGVTLSVGPDYQAVPQGIASVITTGFISNGEALPDAVLAMLPQDFKVIGEFSGPTYTTPVTLTTTPGNPFYLPSMPILGKYTLSNIRLVDSSGNALFAAVPQVVTVESISDPLITSVTTKELTLEELNELGVVFDSTNFTAYQFTAGLGLESNQVPVTFPVLIPTTTTDVNESPLPTTEIGLSATNINDPNLPDNFSLSGFMMEQEKWTEDGTKVTLPPIPGIIIIPNNC